MNKLPADAEQMLRFYQKIYPKWHSFKPDAKTKKAAARLARMRLIKIWAGGGVPMAKARLDYDPRILQETRANPSRRMSKSKRRELMARFLGSEQAEKIMEFGERERREKRAFASGMREIKRLRARGNPSVKYRGFYIDITPGNETTSVYWTNGDEDGRERYSGYSRKEIIADVKGKIDEFFRKSEKPASVRIYRPNPSRRRNAIRVGDMVMGIMGVDGGYVGRVTRISGNIVTFKDDETGKERQTTEYNLTKNIPLRGEYPRRNPSRRGLLQIEKDLKKRAKRMGLTGERARAYIYGTYGRIKRASGY